MPLPLQILFVAFATVFASIGSLMMVAPSKYPKLYAGFLRQSVIQREKTEADRLVAIRVQGLIGVIVGLLFGVFIWAGPLVLARSPVRSDVPVLRFGARPADGGPGSTPHGARRGE